MKPSNIFHALPKTQQSEELFDTLLSRSGIKIERIVSTGQATPHGKWYDQAQDEWVLLIQGQAKLLFENGEERLLRSGDYCFIPAHQKHRVSWTSVDEVCVWLAIYIMNAA